MIEGVTPKLIASDKLSSSAPKREVARKALAVSPSIKSKKDAKRMHITAAFHSWSIANRIPVKPEHIPTVVKILGINLNKVSFFST